MKILFKIVSEVENVKEYNNSHGIKVDLILGGMMKCNF